MASVSCGSMTVTACNGRLCSVASHLAIASAESNPSYGFIATSTGSCRDPDVSGDGIVAPNVLAVMAPPLAASVAAGPRRAASEFVDVHRKWDHTLWRGIIVGERPGDELLQALDRARVQVTGTDLGIEQREAAVDDDAVPVEEPVHLVHLERAPRMVGELHQLRADPRSPEQPVVVVDVVDRLDCHAVLERERQPSDVISREQRAGVRLAQIGEHGSHLRRAHGCSGWNTDALMHPQSARSGHASRSGLFTMLTRRIPDRRGDFSRRDG